MWNSGKSRNLGIVESNSPSLLIFVKLLKFGRTMSKKVGAIIRQKKKKSIPTRRVKVSNVSEYDNKDVQRACKRRPRVICRLLGAPVDADILR